MAWPPSSARAAIRWRSNWSAARTRRGWHRLATAALSELRAALSAFAEPPPPDPSPQPAAKPKGGFFLPDAFTNPAHVQYALKTTGAAMFCYVVYMLLDWPGIHTCLITCFIVSLGTAAETVEKQALRFVGCGIGAAAGLAAIVFLMPNVTSIGGLMGVVFLAALASGWIAAGGPRISYVGFQLAFAFFLSVIQGAAPAFDMTIARDRTIGILFGNLVVAVVFTQIWPVTIAERIDPAIAGLLVSSPPWSRQRARRSAGGWRWRPEQSSRPSNRISISPTMSRPRYGLGRLGWASGGRSSASCRRYKVRC